MMKLSKIAATMSSIPKRISAAPPLTSSGLGSKLSPKVLEKQQRQAKQRAQTAQRRTPYTSTEVSMAIHQTHIGSLLMSKSSEN
ncbi:MAG TPA: hypothetical protein VHO25_11275, partial [Polyangiaceae bacterium]|nr:hypothetical protein [Polyangiaceae bacterium]